MPSEDTHLLLGCGWLSGLQCHLAAISASWVYDPGHFPCWKVSCVIQAAMGDGVELDRPGS